MNRTKTWGVKVISGSAKDLWKYVSWLDDKLKLRIHNKNWNKVGEEESGAISPGGDSDEFCPLPAEKKRVVFLLDVEASDRRPLNQTLCLRLREVAVSHRREAHLHEHGLPRHHGTATIEDQLLNLRLYEKPLDLVHSVEVGVDGVEGFEESGVGVEGVEELLRERQIRPLAPSSVGADDDGGGEMFHETEEKRRRRVWEGGGGEINGDGFFFVRGGPGERGEEVQAEDLDVEGDVDLRGEVLEVVLSEGELKPLVVVVVGRSEDSDFEGKGRSVVVAEEDELLHEGGPMATVADVEVDDVEAVEAVEGLEEGLVGGEVGELENGRDLGEGFVGGDLEDEGVGV